MRRGETPTLTFHSDIINLETADSVYIVFSQKGVMLFEKEKSDITFLGGGEFSITLSQLDTLKTDMDNRVKVQVIAKFGDTVIRSNIMRDSAFETLKDEEV